MAREHRVATIQMNCELGKVKENLNKAKGLIMQAVQQGARLIVLPELFHTGYRVEELDTQLAESIPGPTTQCLEQICKQYQVFIVGNIIEAHSSCPLPYDTAFVVGPSGLLGIYRKIHLWDQEVSRFGRGDRFPVFDLGFTKLGLQICYEIGFPEGARILALQGAEIVAYPAAFGAKRLYAWDIASKARALENGIYVMAANRFGIEKQETVFAGASRIVNPRGEVMVLADQENQVLVQTIDLDLIALQRKAIPYLRDLNQKLVLANYGK